MRNFKYNGRNYRMENGMVHKVDNSGDFTSLDPCYWGDNIIFDAYCKEMELNMYTRPKSIHVHGHQKGPARVRKHA